MTQAEYALTLLPIFGKYDLKNMPGFRRLVSQQGDEIAYFEDGSEVHVPASGRPLALNAPEHKAVGVN